MLLLAGLLTGSGTPLQSGDRLAPLQSGDRLAPLQSGDRLASLQSGDRLAPLIDQLQDVRRQAGLPLLQRRAVLDSAALLRAREIAEREPGQRIESTPELMGTALNRVGIDLYRRAAEHIDIRQFRTDPVSVFTGTWAADALSLDTGFTAIGIAIITDANGYATLVSIFLEDLQAPADLEAVEQQVFTEINRIRRRNGLRRLRWHDELAAVARAHSADMAARAYFDHLSPEGRNPADRTASARIDFTRIAENIEYNRNSPDPVLKAVQDWWDSPGHRANIVEPAFTHTGIGVAVDAETGLYFTQLFLLPPSPGE